MAPRELHAEEAFAACRKERELLTTKQLAAEFGWTVIAPK